MKLVAISGKMHSGKTYVADLLNRELGYRRLSFAQPLKDDVREMGFTEQEIREKEPWMRELLQVYGQARRAQDVDYWVNRMIARLRAEYHLDQTTLFSYDEARIVIDDLRFENEADALRILAEETEGLDVLLVRLERVGYDRRNLPGAFDSSEMALDWYDHDYYFNVMSGDLTGLQDVAYEIVRWDGGRASSSGAQGPSN
jgi:hypothetical protein